MSKDSGLVQAIARLEEGMGEMTTTKEIETKAKELAGTIAQLETKKGEYVERLDIGAAKIEEAKAQGKDVTLWEEYWIQLLNQYSGVCDKQRDLTYQLQKLQPAK